jgi:hypothetical protein
MKWHWISDRVQLSQSIGFWGFSQLEGTKPPDYYLMGNLGNTLNGTTQSIWGLLLEQDNHQRKTLINAMLPFRKRINQVIEV